MNYDWTKFKKEVFIKAKLEDVYNAWAVPNEIIKWFIAEADYTTEDDVQRDQLAPIDQGDSYHWRWHQDLEASGIVHEVIPNERITFTFGKRSPNSNEDVLVDVEITAEADGYTKLSLLQHNMPDTPYGHRYHLSCNLGWSFFMTNLKGLLEHGVDLREKNRNRADAARAISLA